MLCVIRRLDSNALVCDCNMVWLARMIKNKQAVADFDVTCRHPGQTEGHDLMNLSEQDLRCRKYLHVFECDCSTNNAAHWS